MRINIINQQKKEELKNKYIGMKNINTQGYSMTITNYNTSKDIEVTFDDDNHTVVKGIDVGKYNMYRYLKSNGIDWTKLNFDKS